jgi:hypothetical protein
MMESGMVESKTVKRGGKGRDSVYIFLCSVSNVANVAKVANVANVEEIHPDNKGGKEETMATLATLANLATSAEKELCGWKTANEESRKTDDHGYFHKFQGRGKTTSVSMFVAIFPLSSDSLLQQRSGGYICPHVTWKALPGA